jgi:hypothetical protein
MNMALLKIKKRSYERTHELVNINHNRYPGVLLLQPFSVKFGFFLLLMIASPPTSQNWENLNPASSFDKP